MDKTTRKIPITTYLEPKTIQELENIHRKTGKPLSSLLREATEKFLENQP